MLSFTATLCATLAASWLGVTLICQLLAYYRYWLDDFEKPLGPNPAMQLLRGAFDLPLEKIRTPELLMISLICLLVLPIALIVAFGVYLAFCHRESRRVKKLARVDYYHPLTAISRSTEKAPRLPTAMS